MGVDAANLWQSSFLKLIPNLFNTFMFNVRQFYTFDFTEFVAG